MNKEHNTKQKNEGQILWAMFAVLNGIVEADPTLMYEFRTTMKIISDKNPELPKTKPENEFSMNFGIQ